MLTYVQGDKSRGVGKEGGFKVEGFFGGGGGCSSWFVFMGIIGVVGGVCGISFGGVWSGCLAYPHFLESSRCGVLL